MSRPPDTPLDRLRRKVWIRALRIDLEGAASYSNAAHEVMTWKKLGQELLKGHGDAVVEGRLQGILGVVRDGNDPQRLRRRIPLREYVGVMPEKPNIVLRKIPGRAPKGEVKDGKPEEYLEIPTDLIEAGEMLCPGSSHWEGAVLWALSAPALPRLEILRVAIMRLKHRLKLCSPALEQYRPYLPVEEFEAISKLTHAQLIERYAKSLERLARLANADSLSLLGALVAESFITDHNTLLDLHRDYLNQGIERLLAHPLMSDIGNEFRTCVATRILGTGWELPAAYHVSSLSAPFIPMDRWQEITGIKDWIPFSD